MKTNWASSSDEYAVSRVQVSGNDTVPSISNLATFVCFFFPTKIIAITIFATGKYSPFLAVSHLIKYTFQPQSKIQNKRKPTNSNYSKFKLKAMKTELKSRTTYLLHSWQSDPPQPNKKS